MLGEAFGLDRAGCGGGLGEAEAVATVRGARDRDAVRSTGEWGMRAKWKESGPEHGWASPWQQGQVEI